MRNALEKFSKYKISGKNAQGGTSGFCDTGDIDTCVAKWPNWLDQQYFCGGCRLNG